MASAVLLAISTLNYVEFYRAMEQLELNVSEVNLAIEQNITITLVFSLENPTRYVGLKLRELSVSLYFYDKNNEQVNIWADTLSYQGEPLTVEPYWHRTFEQQINLSTAREATQRLLDTYKDPQDIKWVLNAGAIIISFIDTLDVPMSATFPPQ